MACSRAKFTFKLYHCPDPLWLHAPSSSIFWSESYHKQTASGGPHCRILTQITSCKLASTFLYHAIAYSQTNMWYIMPFQMRKPPHINNSPFLSNSAWKTALTFRHRASCILGQVFHYSPENAFYIFNQHIYFII